MKKLLFGIFAHPDDEAFGPAGTLLLETRAGTELHLITLTSGQNGANPDGVPDLGATRLDEWHQAGTLLGATTMLHQGLMDGKLNNISMQRASWEIEQIVRSVVTSQEIPVEVEFMSLDTNGLTGHIDHVVASRAAHYVFYKLKREGLPLTHLRLYALPVELVKEPNIDWIYQDAGHPHEEIDQTVDITAVVDDVRKIIAVHHSQRTDGATRLEQLDEGWRHDHFIVKS